MQIEAMAKMEKGPLDTNNDTDKVIPKKEQAGNDVMNIKSRLF